MELPIKLFAQTGSTVIVTRDEIVLDTYAYKFGVPFEENIKLARVSVSGRFVVLVNSDNVVFLFTIANSSLFVDQIEMENSILDCQISVKETVIAILTDKQKLLFYKTLPLCFIQEFLFYSEYEALSFEFLEATNAIKLSFPNNAHLFYSFPQVLDPIDCGQVALLEQIHENVFNAYLTPQSNIVSETTEDPVIQKIDYKKKTNSLEEAERKVYEKALHLKERQERLQERKNHINQELGNIYEYENQVLQRAEQSHKTIKLLFQRIQRLIEKKDRMIEVLRIESQFAQIESQLEKIKIPSFPPTTKSITRYNNFEFEHRITELKRIVNHRIAQNRQ